VFFPAPAVRTDSMQQRVQLERRKSCRPASAGTIRHARAVRDDNFVFHDANLYERTLSEREARKKLPAGFAPPSSHLKVAFGSLNAWQPQDCPNTGMKV
jgi:hypothetical protein